MAVGMCTVFLILQIVISGGKLLIKIVNKIAPEEVVPAKKSAAAAPAKIDDQTMAILAATVKELTKGKGHLVSAKKI